MKGIAGFAVAICLAGAACPASADAADLPAVKKSDSGICHDASSVHHERMKHFVPFNSMEDCLASGGRESEGPRRASPWRWLWAGAALVVLGLLAWLWMRPRGGGPGKRQDDLERRRWENHRRE